MTPDGSVPADARATTPSALAALLVLAAPALLAWPLPTALHPFDPLPLASAAGLAGLSGIAAIVLAAVATARMPRGALAVLLPALALLLAQFLGDDVPPFENSVPLIALGSGLAVFVAGATFDRTARHMLVRGLAIVSLLYTLPSLFTAATGDTQAGLSGALANVGYTNQAALPGAIAGAWIGVCRRGAWRWIGFAAVGAFAIHTALSPVLAGGLAAGAAFIAAAMGSPWSQQMQRMRGGFGSLAALFVFLAVLSGLPQRLGVERDEAATVHAVEDVAAESEDGGDLGGFEARLRIWGALPPMLAQAGPFGFGSGGFQRSFAPYRDPEEARAAELGGALGAATEVEHPHNDWVAPFIELGWLGGLLWLGFLAICVAAVATSLVERAFGRAVCATAGIAVLFNALVHSNLIANPAASIQAMAVLGVVVGTRWSEPLTRGAARAVAIAPLAVVLIAPLGPWHLVQHGRGLGDYVAAVAGDTGTSPEAGLAGLRTALTQTSDSSATAVELALAQARAAGDTDRLGALVDRLRELRPYSAAAHTQRGLAAAQAGDLETARIAFREAAALRPHDPTSAFNEVRATLQLGLSQAGLAAAADAQARGVLDADRLTALARDAQLGGWLGPDDALALFVLASGPTTADDLTARADLLREQGHSESTANACDSLAQHLWARESAAVGDFRTAVRIYRQAWNYSRRGDRDGSPLLRLELAAAERLDGNPERANDLLAGEVEVRPASLVLPRWAQGALGP